MKALGLRLALQVATLAVVFSTAGHAEDRERVTFSKQGLQAKIIYCKTCHGLSGEGYLGYFPMPRLAGQQSEYLENQLRAFIERRRTNPVMFNVVRVLSPSMITALAKHFMDLNARPFGGAPRGAVAMGKTIYEEGLPEANVPACSACHGSEAKGQGQIPRLAGQLFPYTVEQLTSWKTARGRGPGNDTSAIMSPIAHNLTESQVRAVAAYVSYLK